MDIIPQHQLCGVIVGPSTEHQVDCIEIRADLFDDVNEAKTLITSSSVPVILTLRSRSQGGQFAGTEEERLCILRSLLNLSPRYVDIESDVDPTFTTKLKNEYPNTQIICSYHNFQETPKDLEKIYNHMQRHPASLYKIVTYANSALDAMRMLLFVKRGGNNLIGFCMGEDGAFTRAVAPIMGSRISYGCIDSSLATAPGQYSIDELIDRFRIKEVSKKTDLLGLIGNPVNRSLSIQTHHQMIRNRKLNAIYVQIRVDPQHLELFLNMAKEVGFRGLSITMPHKERVDEIIASNQGAVNTLKLSEGKYLGCNTDGIGAMAAIQYPRGTRIVILGAGGAAYGIAKEALRTGSEVTLVNRTPERARQAAERLGCSWGDLKKFPTIAKEGYDILINTIPPQEQSPVSAEQMIPNKVCLEVVSKPKETPFSIAAKQRGCLVIPGMRMFFEQAKKQFKWWYDEITTMC